MNVNDVGQITAGDPQKNMFWWIRWTHILEELALRQAPYGSVNLMGPDQFPWISHPNQPRGLRILGKNKVGAGDLVKMGQKEHIKDAMNHGRFRIGPAASYADASLNPAIQDDELSITSVTSGHSATIHAFDPATGKTGKQIPTIGEITYSRVMKENFYVMCMTAGYTPRLVDDFNYDAMLTIRNVNRFLLRIERAAKKVRPNLRMAGNLVQYYDPYKLKPDQLDPFFAKNFRFTYQQEYRLVWHSPGLPLDCEPFFVEIGQMKDIATIHVLQH